MIARSRFEALLAERMGLDPESIGPAAVSRAVQIRARDVAQGDLEKYWSTLTHSLDERQALIELVVVPETWFFRYPESLNLFGERVQSMLRARQAKGSSAPVRVISLPCSTGEEPYSIVMALLARGIAREQFVVHGLDISAVAVARARAGVYGKNAFRTEDLSFRDRHFSRVKDDYVLAPSIRAAVDFRVENIFELSADTRASPYDVVFCRNLLIYFDPDTQRRALDVLSQLSTETSELFVGPAEASLLTRSGYASVGSHRAFAFSRTRRVLAEPGDGPAIHAWRTNTSPSNTMPVRANGADNAASRGFPRMPGGARPVRSGHAGFAAPRSLASPAGRPFAARAQGRAQPLSDNRAWGMAGQPAASAVRVATQTTQQQDGFAWIHAMADQGRVEEASQAARQALVDHGPDAGLFYLLGLCLDAQNDLTQAAVHYRKALYLEPDHVQALNHLAVLLEAQGDGASARRMRQRALRKEAGNG